MNGNPQPHSRFDDLPTWVFKVMLLAATIIWGLSFVVMKDAIEVVPPATLIGARFAIAALLVLLFFHRRIRANLNASTVACGLFLGLVYFAAFWVQTIGLTDTTPGKNAFLTATYCVMVPFIYWAVSSRRPTLVNVLAALLGLVGIGLVSLTGSWKISFGDGMTLLCALLFAVHIACLGYFARGRDIFTIAFLTFATAGVLGLAVGLPTEPLPTIDRLADPAIIGQLLYLIVGASFLSGLFQNLGQSRVAPAQASLLLSLESVFGVLFSVLLYGESLTLRLFVGFVTIFLAIVIDETLGERKTS